MPTLPTVLRLIAITALLCVTAMADEPPRIEHGVTAVRLRERGALLLEDFRADGVDSRKWRLWHMDPQAATVNVQGGRLEIAGRGQLGHNGLWSLHPAKYKDVTLVGRMDVHSDGPDPHELLLHLCGGDSPRSPDHWAEVAMRDEGGGRARFSIYAATTKGAFTAWDRRIVLERASEEGFLVRLILDGATNRCTPQVRDGRGQWHSIVDPIVLPLRTTHCELKMRRQAPDTGPVTKSTGWFDDVRLYPNPKSHPVMVRLVRADGRAIYDRGPTGNDWPPKVHIGSAPPRNLEDLSVELWTSDGTRRIIAVQSANLGDYMLPLDEAPWDVYPAAAKIRVALDGKSLGEVAIELEGLSGLYPDDVYEVVME